MNECECTAWRRRMQTTRTHSAHKHMVQFSVHNANTSLWNRCFQLINFYFYCYYLLLVVSVVSVRIFSPHFFTCVFRAAFVTSPLPLFIPRLLSEKESVRSLFILQLQLGIAQFTISSWNLFRRSTHAHTAQSTCNLIIIIICLQIVWLPAESNWDRLCANMENGTEISYGFGALLVSCSAQRRHRFRECRSVLRKTSASNLPMDFN